MVGKVCSAVYTAVSSVALVGKIRLERFHHSGGS